jgi:signal transduction histidine kinase
MTVEHASYGVEDPRLNRFCHDLRQHVVTGLLLSQIVEDGDLENEAHVRLATIHKLFDDMKQLINAEVGTPGPRHVQVELNEMVGDCVRIARVRSNLEIETRFALSASAYGDPTLLRRAVTNVLDNAARAAGERGRVTVVVRESGEKSVIEVTDDGVGFGCAPRGSGHGMSVVALALHACNGRLEIVSGPAPGTTVRLVMPRSNWVVAS